MQFLGEGEAAAQLSSLNTPVLMIGGSSDEVVPVDNLREMARHLPTSWLAIFPGRHGAFLEYQDQTLALFNNFYEVYGRQG